MKRIQKLIQQKTSQLDVIKLFYVNSAQRRKSTRHDKHYLLPEFFHKMTASGNK